SNGIGDFERGRADARRNMRQPGWRIDLLCPKSKCRGILSVVDVKKRDYGLTWSERMDGLHSYGWSQRALPGGADPAVTPTYERMVFSCRCGAKPVIAEEKLEAMLFEAYRSRQHSIQLT